MVRLHTQELLEAPQRPPWLIPPRSTPIRRLPRKSNRGPAWPQRCSRLGTTARALVGDRSARGAQGADHGGDSGIGRAAAIRRRSGTPGRSLRSLSRPAGRRYLSRAISARSLSASNWSPKQYRSLDVWTRHAQLAQHASRIDDPCLRDERSAAQRAARCAVAATLRERGRFQDGQVDRVH